MPDLPELAKSYEPSAVEARRYAVWLESGVFHEEPDPARPPFIISMPPPNITGRAHLGTSSTFTPMDILTRYHRMLGENADWLPGQDHAAIATEAVLVRELAKEGLTREGIGREAFLERAWQWREQYGGEINEAFRALGFGPDWSRERFTLDDGLSAAVGKVFVQLYRDGLIYRGTRLINWDPVSQSTLSDAEVEDEERDGFLWHIRYPGEDGSFSIEVATTRPETMLGDTAVAVHPGDERYAHLVGKHVRLPLVGRSIPILADAAVERDFGSGAVKVTPAHDPLDNEIGERHGLPMPSVIGFDAKMTSEAPAPYAGLDRFEARKAVVRDLEAQGLLVKVEPRRHVVPVSSRSGAVVEPLLSLQWFCKMETLAKPALEAYRDGRVRFVPERFGRTFEHGLENIKDWNISRQVWWGHRLPVWYTPNGDEVVAETEAEALRIARERFDASELRQRFGYARHLVLERALAVLDLRLARTDPRTRALVPEPSPDHEPRHHLPLGQPHDDARPAFRRRDPVQPGLHHAARLRLAGPQDVEELEQRDRSARPDREIRSRRDAFRHRAPDAARIAGAALRRTRVREVPRVQQQVVERAALRGELERRAARARARCRRARRSRWPTSGS